MRLLLDENASAGAAQILRSEGLDVVHAREDGLARADDRDIIAWARQEQRVIVTLDADFHALLALSGATSPSVIRIRIEGLQDEALAALVRRVIAQTVDALARGTAITVTLHAIRLRALPMTCAET